MKPTAKHAVVLVTAPDMKTARKLARAALEARLIACANLIPKIESHYRWQGKIERGTEVLLVVKTTTARLAALIECPLDGRSVEGLAVAPGAELADVKTPGSGIGGIQ